MHILEEADRQAENARTRVTSHRLAPAGTPGSIATSTTTASSRYPAAAWGSCGTTRSHSRSFASGLACFGPSGAVHDVFNDLDRELVFVEVESIGCGIRRTRRRTGTGASVGR